MNRFSEVYDSLSFLLKGIYSLFIYCIKFGRHRASGSEFTYYLCFIWLIDSVFLMCFPFIVFFSKLATNTGKCDSNYKLYVFVKEWTSLLIGTKLPLRLKALNNKRFWKM